MVTTPLPATGPAKRIVPGPAARTGVATGAARSMPRWPASQGSGGGVKRRTIRGCPSSGQRQVEGEALAWAVGVDRSRAVEMSASSVAALLDAVEGWRPGDGGVLVGSRLGSVGAGEWRAEAGVGVGG